MSIPKNSHQHNELLNAFPPDIYKDIVRHLEAVDIKLGDNVCDAGEPINYVYFPESCVLSLLVVMENGFEIECANIGREGVFGLFTGMSKGFSNMRCIVQLTGAMRRCKISILEDAFSNNLALQRLLINYSETVMFQVSQTAGCNALHTIEQRMSRWLLMMHDRAGGDSLTYTQEFLARVLGANRTSITQAAQTLQKRGVITYTRGLMQVQDRKGLHRASCECYDVVQKRFDLFKRPS